MRIKQILWDIVTVTCEEDSRKNDTLYECEVHFNGASVSLRSNFVGHKSLAYAKAELIEMCPWLATFKAHWWNAKMESHTFDKLIPVVIHAQLHAASLTNNENHRLKLENEIRTY